MEPNTAVKLFGAASLLFGLVFAVPLYTSFFAEHYGHCTALANNGKYDEALECERTMAQRFSAVTDASHPKPAR